MTDASTFPLTPLDKATDAQIEAIRRCVSFKARLKPWHRHEDDEIIENLNDLLKLDIKVFRQLSRSEASNIIKELTT